MLGVGGSNPLAPIFNKDMMENLFRIITFLSHFLPYKVACFATEVIADVCYLMFFKKGKRNYIYNIKQTGILNKPEYIRNFPRKVFRNFALFIYEFLIIPRLNERNIDRWIKSHNFSIVKDEYKKGKGVIIQTSHIGNWEWGAALLGINKYPLTGISLFYRSEWFWNFYKKRRESIGENVVDLKNSTREILRLIEHGGMLALLGDRDYTGNGISVKLFGKDTRLPIGGIWFAMKKNIPLIPAFCVKEHDNKYHVYFHRPIPMENTGDFDKDLRNNIKKWVKILEQYIIKYPTQWYIFEKYVGVV